jgi:Asp-tRNA(Asn)/Glu-tRNA(Gln) amidotransferase A subunit family amidase
MLDRRDFLAFCSQCGLASTLFPGVLWALADQKTPITGELINQAALIAGVPIPDELKPMMIEGLNENLKSIEAIRALKIPNSLAPAFLFDPVLPGMKFETQVRPMKMSTVPAPMNSTVPKDLEKLAFAGVRELAELLRTGKVTATALTQMYLARLRRYDPQLKFVITLTEERALAQAKEVDREIAGGHYRGPLHGIPWGAKDLLSVKGYPTTWGAGGFQGQEFDENATVVKRLDEAGAILLAKLTLGALAMGDKWFGGRTRNPWNPIQGSSGSSAGSASATAAGCVGFAIGSETLGSISSPTTRCGTTGLRPTFGMVPRTGAMALSWTMDKLGPICRSVEDCALVLNAIYGPDGHDRTVRRVAFNWDAEYDWRKLRVGYLKTDFDLEETSLPEETALPASPSEEQQRKEKERKKRHAEAMTRRKYDRRFDQTALEKLNSVGVCLIEVKLPKLPYNEMVPILIAEAAAAFDQLTRSGRDRLLTEQGPEDWPNLFRVARFYPAVDYINANRARLLVMEAMAEIFKKVDVIVAPTSSDQLIVTNLTGHPALILPNGFRGGDAPIPPQQDHGDDDSIGGPETPVSLTFLGDLFGEAKLLSFAKAYQDATGFHLKHPGLAR